MQSSLIFDLNLFCKYSLIATLTLISYFNDILFITETDILLQKTRLYMFLTPFSQLYIIYAISTCGSCFA